MLNNSIVLLFKIPCTNTHNPLEPDERHADQMTSQYSKDSRCNCVVQTQYLSFKPLSSDKSPLRFDFGLCSCDVWPRGIKSCLIRLVNPLPGVLFGVSHLLHNSKMRNMHVYQNKGQMQWILGKIYNLNNI